MYAIWFSTMESFRRALLRPWIASMLLTSILISAPSFAQQHSARATLHIQATIMDTVSAGQPIAVQAKVEKSEGIIYNLNPTTELNDGEKASIEVKSSAHADTTEESRRAETPAILESLTFVTQ